MPMMIAGPRGGEHENFSEIRNWKPTLGQGQDFTMADLLKFSGVA
jgi:hypothetical protein